MPGNNEINSLVIKLQTLQSNFAEPSENMNSVSTTMMGTVPPPPLPPNGPPATLKNRSSFNDTKWKMRTEVRDGYAAKAESSIEIPERQSVAALRKQIASKLEVKMPSASSSSVANEGSDGTSPHKGPVSPEQYPPATSSYQHSVPSTSDPASNTSGRPLNESALPEQQSVVHEPVQRHLSCITPVSFSRTVVLASPGTSPWNSLNLSPSPAIYRSATFPPSTTYENPENNDSSSSVAVDSTRATQFNEDQQVKLWRRTEEIPRTSFLPTATMPTLLGLDNFRNGTGTIDQSAHAKPPSLMNGDGGSRNEETGDLTPRTNDRIPEDEAESRCAASALATTWASASQMPPFSKPVELRTKIPTSTGSLLPQHQPQSITSFNDECELKGTTFSRIRHGKNSTWYRTMYMKMHNTDQSNRSALRYQQQGPTSPASTLQRTTRAWTPNPRPGNQVDSLKNYELQSRRSKSVGRHVEAQTRMGQDNYIDGWREDEDHWLPGRRSDLGSRVQNGQITNDAAELKRLTKEELLTRQKVEKLSDELLQQRNRRHGYVPSASPALQKNFDRFNGLINEFGHPQGSRKSCAVSPSEIATCTALYSFKALSPKELSFNRGDVIRVHRIIDVNWMEGERNGQMGIFPSSYVQVDNNKMSEQIKLVALYPFFARNKNELSLKKGEMLRYVRNIDANWIEGVNIHGQTGIFPKMYVHEAHEADLFADSEAAIPDRPKTPRMHTAAFREKSPVASLKTIQGNEVKGRQEGLSGPADTAPKNAETYRALYAYKPRNGDELELEENDTVFVVEKCDDGWFIGTSLRTGQFGTFPGNYVEKHDVK